MLPVRSRIAVGLNAPAEGNLLNVSYDVARDFYKDYNPLFQKHWEAKTGEKVELRQSQGAAPSRPARWPTASRPTWSG